MSRYTDDYDEDNPSQYLWESNYRRALKSKRGQKMLSELREALVALPKHELIAGAMCTMNSEKRMEDRNDPWGYLATEFAEKGEGVCAMGAYAWHKLVRQGVDSEQAWDQIPTMMDSEGGALWETAEYARQTFGVAVTLAWDIAYRNDEQFQSCTPAERWNEMLAWVERQLLVGISAETVSG